MDTVGTRVPFVHAIFKSVAYFRRSYAMSIGATTDIHRRAHVIHYVAVAFRFEHGLIKFNRDLQ